MPFRLATMPREHQFPFELRHLVYFHEVARRLHFRRAATALAVTQPALSRQIQQLERALGVDLFVRHSRRVELTPEGRLLAQKCAQLFPQVHGLVEEIGALAKGAGGVLRIMFSSLAMASVLPGALRAFSEANPKVQIDLAEAGTEPQLQAVRDGLIHVGFAHPETLPPGFGSVVLAEEPMGLVLARDHWLARLEKIRPRDLAHEELILFAEAENPALYRRMLTFWRGHGFEPRVRQQGLSRANRVALAVAGLGVTYACPSEAAALPAEAVFRPLAPANFLIATTAIWRSEGMTPLLRKFLGALQSRAKAGQGQARAAAF